MSSVRVLLLTIGVFLLTAGCASLRRDWAREASSQAKQTELQGDLLLLDWEKRLDGLKGADRVSVPVQTLRGWIRNERAREERYRELMNQLKALKSIDSEEARISR